MKTIHIPKVKGEFHRVKFYRSKSRKYTIYLQKQEIEGIIVPKDTEINIDWERYYLHCHSDEIEIPVFYVNRMLRYIYLNQLRNEKN